MMLIPINDNRPVSVGYLQNLIFHINPSRVLCSIYTFLASLFLKLCKINYYHCLENSLYSTINAAMYLMNIWPTTNRKTIGLFNLSVVFLCPEKTFMKSKKIPSMY